MSKRANKRSGKQAPVKPIVNQNQVDSLYDKLVVGKEYQSIVDCRPGPNLNLIEEILKGLREIQRIRNRLCICYIGDVVSNREDRSIDSYDDLPFHEMVSSIPNEVNEIDVFLSTFGGSAHQVGRFVNALRERFESVDFIIPSFCMSAGTLFALSGNNIIMTERACLGPIDPQVPTKDGFFVPAQALVLLVNELQKQGDEARKQGQPVPWTAVRIIDTIDKKDLGAAITATNYSTMMATQYIKDYKFQSWTVRESTGEPVTEQFKEARAEEIAKALASHERWKNHGHALSRKVLEDELKLKVEIPDTDLNKAIINLWAICHWVFDKTQIVKILISENYRYVRFKKMPEKR